jgi:RNA polymerase sigma-70 factor (ECF subfamily)
MSNDGSRSRLNTRPSLLLRIRDAEDAGAWRTFVDLYAPVIYGYSRKQGLIDADAADVVQEVLAQVARSIRTFEYQPEKGRFRNWLCVVTRSKIGKIQRRSQAQAGATGLDDELVASVGEEPAWVELFNSEVLRAALARIRPNFGDETWQIFERVWIQDEAPAEVARALSRPIHAVYVAKSRVLLRLREEILSLAEDLAAFVPLR